MKLALNASAVLAAAALGVGGWLAWRAYKGGAGILAGAQQAAEQAAANVQSAWVNSVSGPFAQGYTYGTTGERPYVSEKAWLYSDYGYTGVDPQTGALVTDGEWYGDAVARRYEAEQYAAGTAPPATSINGAAFGIYPRP